MDWYMFSPAEHEYLRFMETNIVPVRYKQNVYDAVFVYLMSKKKEPEPEPPERKTTWRKYGEKTNTKKGETRQYYKCNSCTGRRVEIYDLSGTHVRDEVISHHRRKKEG